MHYEKFADGTVKCIENQIPYQLPEGWRWERLGNISTIARGGSPRPIDAYLTTSPDGLNWIKIGDTERDGKYIYSTQEKIIPEGLSKTRPVFCGDFLLTNSMSFGRPYILKTDGCIHDGWLVIGNIEEVFDQDFLYYALSSSFMYKAFCSVAAGSTVKNLKSDSVKAILFPVPPLNEQRRIAHQTEEYTSILELLNRHKESLLEFCSIMKQRVLDLAIQGKLVPQDPTDEPASVLLERIRAEKEELVRQGKIKRDKKDSIIFKGEDNSYYEKIGKITNCIEDEIPYAIPEGWRWVRLCDCCIKDVKRGKSPKYSDTSSVLVFAQKCNTKYSGIDLSRAQYLNEETLPRYSEQDFLISGDVVINSTGTGTLGRVGIYRLADNPKNIPVVPDSHVTVVRSSKQIDSMYLYSFLKANQGWIETLGEGSTNQKELRPDSIMQLLVPLPPDAEQIRITNAIMLLFSHIAEIEKSLM